MRPSATSNGSWLSRHYAPGFMRPTAHNAVTERVDEQGHVLGFSLLGVSRFRKGHPLEVKLVAKEGFG
ncbi:MAG: hypothetical protein HY348_11555 [Nitrospira defluvii]|nr:hypothetical protein [Nitrospira defluvii]